MKDAQKRTVLYIAGWGRTGSTILGNILGQLPGFSYVGEVASIWTCGVVQNTRCGCGARFRDCEMWRAVFQRAFGGIETKHAERLMASRQHWPNNKMLLFRSALGLGGLPRVTEPAAAEYADGLRALYEAIGDCTGSRVIVDSSKTPSYAFALASLPNVDLRLLHLVRDPRATAYSWLRHIGGTDANDRTPMKRLGILRSSAQWTTWNAATMVVSRAMALPTRRLSYEDFVERPQEAVWSSLQLVSDVATVQSKDVPFVSPTEVELRATHNVWGNLRYRQRTGRVAIVHDNEWDTNLTPFARAVVAGLTYPLARQYGYYDS